MKAKKLAAVVLTAATASSMLVGGSASVFASSSATEPAADLNQGDASTAFEEHYQNERGNFEAFATTIEDYIAKLQEILANWEAAESANVQIGSD